MAGANVPQLMPAAPRQMLGEALRHVRSLPRDAAQRADAFEALARQIEQYTGGALDWEQQQWKSMALYCTRTKPCGSSSRSLIRLPGTC